MIASFSRRLSVVILIAVTVVQSNERKELATFKCDGSGNFIVAMEYGLSLIGKTSVTFDVKACEFVVLALTETVVIKHNIGNYILIILGHEKNTKSILKDSCFHCDAVHAAKKKVLNCSKFLPFWMSWDDKRRLFMIGEGEVVNKHVLMEYTRKTVYPLYFLQVTSGRGRKAEIRLYKDGEDELLTFEFETPKPDGSSVVSLEENTVIGTKFYKLQGLGGQESTFEVVNHKDMFQCDGDSIKVIGNLDYEKQKSYFITIKAMSIYTSLTINVSDRNDNVPVIKMAAKETRIFRESPVGYVIRGMFTIYDMDIGDKLTINYDIKETSPQKVPIEDYITLKQDRTLVVKKTPLDMAWFRFAIIVSDSVGHTSQKEHTVYIVTTTNDESCQNGTVPVYFLGPASDGTTVVKVREGHSKKGLVIYEIKLTNPKLGFLLQLKGGADDIYLEGLLLKLNHPLKYHTKPQYKLQISTGTQKVNFTVEVLPDPVEMLVFVENHHTRDRDIWKLPEELPIGHMIARLYYRKSDEKHTYSISGSRSKYFYMNKNTGELSIRSRINRDGRDGVKNITMKVRVSTSMATTSYAVFVIITDINDNVPTFSQPFYNAIVTENNTKEETLLNLICSDADVGDDADDGHRRMGFLRFGSDVNQHTAFKLADTRLIALAGAVKYNSSRKTVTLEILAVDAPGFDTISNTGRTIVFVKILPRNDHTPFWISPEMKDRHNFLTLNIPDNISNGATLTIFKARDPDPYSKLTYHIDVAKRDGYLYVSTNLFSLNSKTGEFVMSGFNRSSYYLLLVRVTDGVHSNHSYIKIKFSPVNKHPPIFEKHWFVITRNSQKNTLLEFGVTDKDSDFKQIRVLLSKNAKARGHQNNDWVTRTYHFKIEKLKTKWRLIRNARLDSYKDKVLLLKALDGGHPELSGIATVLFNISKCDTQTNSIAQDTSKRYSIVTSSFQLTKTSPSQQKLTSPSPPITQSLTQIPGLPLATSQSSLKSRTMTPPHSPITSPYSPITSQLKLKTSPSKIWKKTTFPVNLTKAYGRLLLRSTLFTNMTWKEAYKNTSNGKLIMKDINKQLTSVFSSIPEFHRSEIQRLVNFGGSVTAKYAVYFTHVVNSTTIDRLLQTLEKKPLEIQGALHKQGISVKCVKKSAVSTSQFDAMKLKIISIAEGVLLIIIITTFVIAKLCFTRNRAVVRPEEENTNEEYRQSELKLEERANHLRSLLDELEKENIELKTSIDKAKLTIVDEVDGKDFNQQTASSEQLGDLFNNQDSAFWSSHTGESVYDMEEFPPDLDGGLDSSSNCNTEEGNDGGETQTSDSDGVRTLSDGKVQESIVNDVIYCYAGDVTESNVGDVGDVTDGDDVIECDAGDITESNVGDVGDVTDGDDVIDITDSNVGDIKDCEVGDVTDGNDVIECDIDTYEQMDTQLSAEGKITKHQISMGSLVLQAMGMKEKIRKNLNRNKDLAEDSTLSTEDTATSEAEDNSERYQDKTVHRETVNTTKAQTSHGGVSYVDFDVTSAEEKSNLKNSLKRNVCDVVTQLMTVEKPKQDTHDADDFDPMSFEKPILINQDSPKDSKNDVIILENPRENDSKSELKTKKTVIQSGFGDVVVDIMRFKYLLEDEVNVRNNIPAIYTHSENNKALTCYDNVNQEIGTEDATEVDKNQEDIKLNMDRNQSTAYNRKESIPSILQCTFDVNQEDQKAPCSTLDKHSSAVVSKMTGKQKLSQVVLNLLDSDPPPAESSEQTAAEQASEISEINSLLGEHLTYTEDMAVQSPVNLKRSTHITVSSGEDCMMPNKTFDYHSGNKEHFLKDDDDHVPSTEYMQSESLLTPVKTSKSVASKRDKYSENQTETSTDDVNTIEVEASGSMKNHQLWSEGHGSVRKKSKRRKETAVPKEIGSVEDEMGAAMKSSTHSSGVHLQPISKKQKQKTSKHKKQISTQKERQVDDRADVCQEIKSASQGLTPEILGDVNEDGTIVEIPETCVNNEHDDKDEDFLASVSVSETSGSSKTKKPKRSKNGKSKGEAKESVTEGKNVEEREHANMTDKQAKVEKRFIEKLPRRSKRDT